MRQDWPTVSIEECAADEPYATQIGPFGNKIKASIYTPEGAPVLRGTNVNPDGRFHDDDFVFVSHQYAQDELHKFVCEANDVILCHKGTLGKIGIVPKVSRYKRYIMGNSMMKVRCNADKMLPLYLYYWLCSRAGQSYLFSRVSQVGVPQIQRPLTTLREATLPCPSLDEQRAITKVLSTLDDKIELNRRMSETLEGIARAIFKSWFVDFDPVRAKMNGEKPTGMDDETANVFPASFVDTTEGNIPAGWRVEKLSQAMTFQGGSQPPAREFISEKEDGYVRLVQIRDFYTDSHLTYVPDTPKLRRFTVDDVMIARYGSSSGDGNDSLARICRGLEGAYNVALVKVIPHLGCREFLYYFLQSEDFQAAIRGMGARSVQSGFRKADLDVIPVVLADEAIHEAFERFANPIWKKVFANRLESRRLAQLRDTLLPKLLSGEIRVGQAEKLVEAQT